MSFLTKAVEGRFTAPKLARWLEERIESGASIYYDRTPDTGRCIRIIPGGSAGGLQMDGLFDAPTFQIQCRGGENNYEDAEAIAYEIDNVFLNSSNNIMVGDCYVQVIDRIGGAPQNLQIRDPESRFVFTCTYYAIASTGV
jgi:hypothetical protein